MTQPTKRVLQPLGEGFTFVKLDGSEISNEEFLESIPMTGQKVVIIPSGAPFEKTTEQLKDLLADSTIIMKMPVSLTYDE